MSKLEKICTAAVGVFGAINITISFVLAIMDKYPEASWYMISGFMMVWLFDTGRKRSSDEKEKE